MRKFLYSAVAIMATLLSTSCLYGIGTDEAGEDIENNTGFTTEVSANIISANGEDTVNFFAYYNGEDVTAEATLFDQATNKPLESMSFSTFVAGKYQFYITYGEHRSDVIEITAVLDIDLSDTDDTGLTVSVSTNLVQVGKSFATFIIRYDGKVLSNEEIIKVSIYDAANDTKVFDKAIYEGNSVGSEFSFTAVEDKDGKMHTLLAYSPNEVATKSFWVSYKTKNTRETPVAITSVNTLIPSRPADSQPANTNFLHRTLFTQFTGTWCGYCPYMIAAFHNMLVDYNYNNKFVHTAVHGGDKFATTLSDGRDMASLLNKSGGYPYVLVNLANGIQNSNVETNMAYLQAAIANNQKSKPLAGIAVRTELKSNTLLVRASVKVAQTDEYFIGAWVVESGMYAQQSNYTALKDDYLDYHENVVRIADSNTTNFMGHSMGIINKGERADRLFVMQLDPSWKYENCHLVLFVSTYQGNTLAITNATQTASLTSGVEFEYN